MTSSSAKRYFLFIITIFATSFFTELYACSKVVVCQNMDLVKVFASENTQYIIRETIDLEGRTVNVGKGSILVFKGGTLSNGTVVGNETRVKAANYEIFKRGYTRYRAYHKAGSANNNPPSLSKQYHHAIILEGTWKNKYCSSNWTGLLNGCNEDVMLAVRNYIILHSGGAKVLFPSFHGYGYETTSLPGGHIIDFNQSTISYPENLSVWEDTSLKLPKGATPCEMESGYGLLSMQSNTTIKNLSIDGKSASRQEEPLRLGVSCIIAVGNAQNVTFENVSITNVLGPCVTSQAGSKNLTYRHCKFTNIGEHIFYSHQYQGYCHFEQCVFDTWDSERLSVHRNGMDYLFKHAPLLPKGVSYDEVCRFDLQFDDCIFINPKRVNAQGRTLGGFFTGDDPVVVKVNDCKFVGAQTAFNPGGGPSKSEASGKHMQLILRGCDGAPYVYPSKSNYNIVTEYYDCINIPFRTVYARRYDNCTMYLDVYEDDIENVSTSFECSFLEPLQISNCIFVDRGTKTVVNHPVNRRPVCFRNCFFQGTSLEETNTSLLTVQTDEVRELSFERCEFDLPGYRLVNGNGSVETIVVKKCKIHRLKDSPIGVKTKSAIMKGIIENDSN